jgi:hypothetical protein
MRISYFMSPKSNKQCCGSRFGEIPDAEKIKIIPDPGSSGSEMNLKKNYSEKLIKFDNFSTKFSIKKKHLSDFFLLISGGTCQNIFLCLLR